jgi:hypothetical protein
MHSKSAKRGPEEFGDFQTPLPLAADVCRFLSARGVAPASVVEPNCGVGNFVLSALDRFPTAAFLGADINSGHIDALAASLKRLPIGEVRVLQRSFFEIDWREVLEHMREPVLVLGNPPWVTNARLGTLASENLPEKRNVQGHVGLDAVTGKSNFDISEWMLIRLLEALSGRRSWLAMLCKTAVARKALAHAWKNGITIDWAEIREIDAVAYFGAAVEACLLVCSLSPDGVSTECAVYPDFGANEAASVVGWCDGQLVAEVRSYERWKHLRGEGPYQWRSGVKHDCSKVMELLKEPDGYRNGLGELVELEDEYLFPMLKSSELANGDIDAPVRWMIVPQRAVGDDTGVIEQRAPRTWQYLLRHQDALDRRASSIYRNRPRFSVFGVGDYTFAPWKVGISGFYKRLKFAVIGTSEGKPTVLDDTSYFVACGSEQEARLVTALLNSEISREFFSAFTFWDAKRPITAELLRRLDVMAVARETGVEQELTEYLGSVPRRKCQQASLFASG